MKSPASVSLASITSFILYSIPLLTTGAYAQVRDAGPDSPLTRRRVEVDIENHGTVELMVPASGALEIQLLPDLDISNAVVRSDGPVTCFFHKWPPKGFPEDDGLFVSIPIRSDGATAEQFEEFEAAQRVVCYDSTKEWSETTRTLLFQQGTYFSLEHVEPTSPGGGHYLNYEGNAFGTGGKRLDAAALLYPAHEMANCRLFNTWEDYPVENRATFREYGTVYFRSPRLMNPDVRVRRIECN